MKKATTLPVQYTTAQIENLSTDQLRALALMQFHGEEFPVDPEDIPETKGGDYNDRYWVLTDSEADEKAADYIKDSLWAFNPDFLASETGFDYEIFKAIADNGKCESNNDVIHNTIQKTCGIDSFVESAISADGRGRFLSSYDGYENEETVFGETFYIYRVN